MHLDAIAIILVISLALGLLLYLPIRWLMTRNLDQEQQENVSRPVPVKSWPSLVAAISAFLVVVWFREAGHPLANSIFTIGFIALPVAALIVLARWKKG